MVAGLTNLVWEKLEPLPRFSAVIEQKTDIWTEFWRFLTIFFRFFQNGLKLIYSEKATNFCEISTVDLSYVVTIKSMVEIAQNFVAFSEYMNFIKHSFLKHYFCPSFGVLWTVGGPY